MPFQPVTNQRLVIGGRAYRLAAHPAAPALPYGQEGRQAVVYALVEAADAAADPADEPPRRWALKVFKPRYRSPGLVALADRLATFAELPGLAACRRIVLTPHRHPDLLGEQPDLLYAVLMPWIPGRTWFEVMAGDQALTPGQSLILARGLAEVLSRLEECGLAHCDLSAPNVLLPALAPAETVPGEPPVALVDVEQLYGPGLERPAALTSGSPGYARRQGDDELWQTDADRFAGAILLAEMLGWCDARVRAAAWGEGYFDPAEMQADGERSRLLAGALAERWGEPVGRLFTRAWQSERMSDCATFGEWLLALPERPPIVAVPAGAVAATSTTPPTPAGDATRPILEQARRLEDAGDLAGALAAYRRALALAPAGSALATELALVITRWPTPAAPPVAAPAPAELAELFDDAAAAAARGEWPAARELLAEVERRQPDYRRGGQAARALLAEAEQRLGAGRARGTAPGPRPGSPRRPLRGRVAATAAGLVVVGAVLIGPLAQGRVGPDAAPRPAPVTTTVGPTAALATETPVTRPPGTATAGGDAGVVVRAMLAVAAPASATPTAAPASATPTAAPAPAPLRGWRAHDAVVRDVAFSPDGQLLASASDDGTVKLWRVADGALLRTLGPHRDAVFALAFSPDGQQLASGSADRAVRLWRVGDGALLRVLGEHDQYVSSVAFSPDGALVASASGDRTVRLWPTAEGDPRALTTRAGAADAVAFTPDGRALLTGSKEGQVQLWGVPDGALLRTFSQGGVWVEGVAVAPDGRTVAAGDHGGGVRRWRLDDGRPLDAPSAGGAVVRSVAFSADGALLAAAGAAPSVAMWWTGDSAPLGTLAGQGGGVFGVAFARAGPALLAAGAGDGRVQLWRAAGP